MGGNGGGCEYSGSCSLHRNVSSSNALGKYGNVVCSVSRVVGMVGSNICLYNSA